MKSLGRRVINYTRHNSRVAWGKATWHQRPPPDFLIIGAQRAGTTSMSQDLAKHPQVAIPLTKEIHYFDRHHARGLHWYLGHFPTRRHRMGRITGEATTDYLFHPHAHRWAAEELPTARFVVLLRNPVDRAVSHWALMIRQGREDLPLERALRDEEQRIAKGRKRLDIEPHHRASDYMRYSYRSRGRYAEQLERWFSVIDRSRFLIVRAEDHWANPVESFGRVTRFLGIDDWAPASFAHVHGAGEREVPDQVRRELEAEFTPLNDRLDELLGVPMHW